MAALVILGAYSLRSVAAALRALSLIAIIRCLNPILVSFPEGGEVVAWISVLAAAVRLVATLSRRDTRLLLPLGTYVVTVAALAVFSSVAVEISLMKLLTFTLVSAATLVGWLRLEAVARQRMVVWFSSLIVAVLVLSAPTFFVAAVGFANNGLGFQGVLNQPQLFGSFMVPVVVWATANGFIARRTVSVLDLGVIGLLWLIMLSSLSRNAAVASLLALSLGPCLMWRFSRSVSRNQAARLGGAMLLLAAVVILAVAASPTLRDNARGFFIDKWGEGREFSEAYRDSRGWLIAQQWESFLARPLTGHGFQVYPSGVFPGGVIEVMGIPVSAAVEKGFVGTTVLEETGIIGAFVFVGLLFGLLRAAMATGDVRAVCLLLACVLINVGECIFFSIGGLGLYAWLLMGMAVSVPSWGARSDA